MRVTEGASCGRPLLSTVAMIGEDVKWVAKHTHRQRRSLEVE